MALIKCPECGKEISEKASFCPGCGCPSSEWKNTEVDDKEDLLIQVSDEILEMLYNETNGNRIILIKSISEKCNLKLSEAKKVVDEYWSRKFPEKKLYYTRPVDQSSLQATTHKNPKHEFHGIYRYGLFGGKTEVYCPRCSSENCSYYHEKKIIPGKIKTRYAVNLNPLKPFTLVNKKEKVVKKEKAITEVKIICNDCGCIFN